VIEVLVVVVLDELVVISCASIWRRIRVSTAPAMSSAAPLMARFEEQQPEEGAAAALVAPEASSEAGRKGLEDGVAGNDKLVSMADVSKHKSQGDAWVVVDGVVYDISLFVDTHPGGVEVIRTLLLIY
jgi:cytochrome b involved in lipid metabolism